jgi:xanthine dehydrogenase accessory factor
MYKGFRGNPVLIDRSLFPEMMQLSGDIGCRSLFGLHPEAIQKIAVEDIGILVDIDTAEDLKKLSRPGLDNVDLRDRSLTSERAIAIIGNDELVVALTRLAKVLKFQVFVFDPLLTPDDLPQADRIINDLDLAKAGVAEKSAIVIASRGKFDEEALEQAVRLGAGYIALMGSKKRGAELIASLRAKKIPEETLTRIHSPAGLAIGAETPEEIALSIMAEIVLTTKSQRHKETTK